MLSQKTGGIDVDMTQSTSLESSSPSTPSLEDGASPLAGPSWACVVGESQRSLKGEDCYGSRRVTLGGEEVVLAMVADGHGGSAASKYCEQRMLDYFLAAADGDACALSLRSSSEACLARAHSELIEITTAGSTVTLVALNLTRGELTVANVGDSEGWLVPSRGEPVRLTEDHRLETSAAERERVRKMGAHLAHAKNRKTGQPGGPLRLWPGGVAQARSVGDADVGKYILPAPAVRTLPLPAGGCDVIVASDGLWDALYPSHVAAGLRQTKSLTPEGSAEHVINRAINQRHAYDCDGYLQPRDDTTVIVLRISSSGGGGELGQGGGGGGGGACCAIQ